jgi:hypothetical protein
VNRYGISLTVLIGSVVGVLINYPHAPVASLVFLATINAGFAFFACVVLGSILRYFGVIPEKPH